MLGIGQTDKWVRFALPMSCKGFCIFWSYHDDDCLTVTELFVILAQLRQVPAAERSGKPPIEDEDDVLLAAISGESSHLTMHVDQAEIWCCCSFEF